jgi:hypothetical protein
MGQIVNMKDEVAENATPEAAAHAIRAAGAALDAMETANEIVQAQAVMTLVRQGRTIRDIAGALGLSKSHVGRIARHSETEWPVPVGSVVPQFVQAAWNAAPIV